MRMHTLIAVVAFLLLNIVSSCSTGPKNIAPNDKELLALALSEKNFKRVSLLMPQVRMTENSINTIQLYLVLHSENRLKIEREVEYLKQFLSNMGILHQSFYNKMAAWLYIKQIYRHEISPPVRIIQREKLYLEPSHIDFLKCPSLQPDCATEIRAKLSPIMTNEQISDSLKKMALRDPCVNSSSRLQAEIVANRCLRKSKGNLKIELLAKPRFSTSQWLQIISTN